MTLYVVEAVGDACIADVVAIKAGRQAAAQCDSLVTLSYDYRTIIVRLRY
jgi:hypothetical protein